MPPPMSFKSYIKHRSELAQSKAKTLRSAIIVSPSKPHSILSISEGIADFLHFTRDELSGRTIRVLQGPKSNPTALDAAIKASVIDGVKRVPFVFYSSSGAECEAIVNCAPLFEENAKICGCTLEISFPFRHNAQKLASCSCIDQTQHFHEKAELLNSEREEHLKILVQNRNYRAQYNFRTGLTIHQAFCRQKRASAQLGSST